MYLIPKSGITPERLQLLFDKGVLDTVFDSDAFVSDAVPLREALGLSVDYLEISVDYDQPLGEMIRAAAFKEVSSKILEADYPLVRQGVKRFACKLLHLEGLGFTYSTFDRSGLVLVEEKVRRTGWKLGRIEHAVAFAGAHPEQYIGQGNVMAIGHNRDMVPCLSYSKGEGCLDSCMWYRCLTGEARVLVYRPSDHA